MNTLICRKEQRREAVRQQTELYGLDYVEVGPGRRTLTVYFLGKAPASLDESNVIIEGGRRIQDIRVIEVTVNHSEMIGLDDTMEVVTDREGDFSTYALRVVAQDEDGRSLFDPRYDRVEFSFRADCPSDLDCKQEVVCPPEQREEPVINYLAKDYASFRQLILDRLALVIPDWRERHVPDLGIALVELFAYVGDHLSYYQDAVATEAYLDTARQRISVRRHAWLVDYVLHEGCNARTWVCVETDSNLALNDDPNNPDDVYFITTQENIATVVKEDELARQPAGSYEVFEPMMKGAIKLYKDQHEIHFYTWGDEECCLLRGTTTATLIGKWIEPEQSREPIPCDPIHEIHSKLSPSSQTSSIAKELHLKPGDVLIFEEMMGPKTGNPADANPQHRHPVQIVKIRHVNDPLYPERKLTEITWAEEDALPFPLCLSAMGPPPECKLIENISVARGNLILVDHGRREEEDLDPVLPKETIEACDCAGHFIDTVTIPQRYRPYLKKSPLTLSEPLATNIPASRMLTQNVRHALPQVKLNTQTNEWFAQQDLLSSNGSDPHFVVEMENDQRARLRFGDDELGQQPEAGTVFHTSYRVGNGQAGNVGADSITHLVTRKLMLSGGIRSVRNPLAAIGGTAPESLAEAKLFAPYAFKQRQERAITAEDYTAIVMREFGSRVQRAATTLHWNGSWFEVLVAVDPFGAEQAEPELLDEIEARLHRYRRISHGLSVEAAHRVPLDIELIVCVLPNYLRGHVKAELLEVFSNRQSSDDRLGLFHVDRLTFGDDIYLSTLVAEAQRIQGVESIKIVKMQRLYEPANSEIENGVLPLGPLEIARLDNDPSFPENGRIRFDMRGGR
ncbi:putative baseplate assembly protein [Nitrosomonas sp. Nm166]|uniref:putative baseplate assembly protein n=1 Tax=Nitrosomonas sp. Nm166 TaxID=1881054 RepID=UPI0008ED69B1|nr:putative baseplate assembly protein [Nitrosomonas sp. Nm166]SFE86074.1 putative baseplate assembly protein [Nitrosomonas sp. Nm166]